MCSSADSTSTARWLSSGFSGVPGSPGWNSTNAPPTSTRGVPDAPGAVGAKPSDAYSPAVSSGFAEKSATWSRSYSTSVSASTRTEPHAFCADVEVGLARAGSHPHRAPAAALRARIEARSRSATCLSAPRSRGPSASKSVSFPAARVRADERERLRPVDHVHAEMRRDEIGDRLALGDPVRNVVELRRVHASTVPRPRSGYARLLAPVDCTLKLLLRHARAAGNVHPLRFVVQLAFRSAGSCRSGGRRGAPARDA